MTALERLPTDLSPSQARELFDEIKNDLAVPLAKLERAFLGRAWIGLGYSSWQECCAQEFESARLKLTPTERHQVVVSLSGSSLSTRAIAAAVGVNDRTIRRDLSGAANAAPDGDGPPDPEADDFFVDLVPCNDDEEDTLSAPQPRTTGMDGKSYARSAPARLRSRSPLPDFAFKTGVDLRRLVDRLERIAADDRLNPNREQVGIHLRSHLNHTIDVCTDLLDRLNQEKPR